MHAPSKLVCQQVIDRTMPVHPAHARERLCNNPDAEMGFSPFAPSAMSAVLFGFVDDLERSWRKSLLELAQNSIPDAHGSFLRQRRTNVNPPDCLTPIAVAISGPILGLRNVRDWFLG